MNAELKIRRLCDWLKDNGASFHTSIEIDHNATRGFYVRARQEFKPPVNDLEICSCPFSLSLSALNVRQIRNELNVQSSSIKQDAGPVAEYLVGRVDVSVLGYFVLMEQRLLGEQSFWYPYIDMLPIDSELETPLYFDESDLEWLSGTNMHLSSVKSAVYARREARRQEWTFAAAVLASHFPEDAGQYTFDLYLWAATIFTSRSFSFTAAFGQPGDAFSILYPGVDLLNHAPGAKVSWDFHAGDFTLSTRQAIAKDAEVYNNYAPKGNEELLMGYGFTIEGNPTDTVRIVLPQPPAQVHRILQSALPEHFKSESWDNEEATFMLRGKSHYAGPYDHDIACLRGVPYAMFRMMAESVYFMSTGDSDGAGAALQDDDFFSFVIEQFLAPLRTKRAVIPEIAREPQNQKQRFAKIYRDGQIKILDEVISDLEDFLAGQH